MPLLRDDVQTDLCQSVITRITTGNTIPAPLLRVYQGSTMIAECTIGAFATPVGGFSSATVTDDTGVIGTPDRYEIVGRDGTVKMSGSISEIPHSLVDGEFRVIGGLRIMSPAFQILPDEIGIITEGATFAPELEVIGTPTILWTFEDGSTSNSATPTVNFGSARSRLAKIKVTPWSALITKNFGYIAGDGGDLYTSYDDYFHADQRVSEVINLHLASSSLTRFLASGYEGYPSLMQFADFTGFEDLEVIEFFIGQVKRISLTSCTSLRRLCLEQCGVTALDLSDSPVIEDIRAAGSVFTSITFAAQHPNCWHLCVQGSANLSSLPALGTTFPALRELWAWSCNLSGNLYISTANTQLDSVRLNDNNFSSTDIDTIITQLLALNKWFAIVNLNDNAAPTNMVNVAALDARCDVFTYDEPSTPTLSTPTFNPAGGSYSSTQSITITFDENSDNTYYRIDGGNWTAYTTPISVSASQLLEAYSTATGYNDSNVGSATYTISNQLSTPIFNPAGGSYSSTQSITITFDENSDNTYYRIDGGSWTAYTTPISVSASQLLEAYSTATGYTNSDIGSANYTIGSMLLSRIDFVTDGADVNMEVQLGNTCDVTWHWSDDTTSTSLTPTKNFGSAATREHYVTFSNPAAVTRFGRGSTVCLIYSVDADWSEFPNCSFLMFYRCGLINMRLSGGVFNQLHLRNDEGVNVRTPQSELDNWLIELAENSHAAGTREFFIQDGRSNASDAAWATLTYAAGWTIYGGY